MNLAVLSLVAAQDKHKLASTTPWLLLVDFNWQGEHVRVVRNTDPVTFDAGDGAGPQVYSPWAFEITGAQTTNDGSLPQIALKVSNINRLIEGALIQYSGAVGATASLYVLNTEHPAGEPDLAMQTTIMRTSTTAAWVTFTLSAISPLRALFPKYLYYQGTCNWQYKGLQCGYAGGLTACDLTFDGANGCIAHANQARFGGYPGIGSNGASVAGQI
jgi:lambda family phage minor tail protein L